jgi:oxygen-independent coproporphyrinogen-3 oxidase
MWTYHPQLLEQPVPRYTSYPTAAEFNDAVGPDELCRALDLVGEKDRLSLYVHIPYCQEICWYCGCNTGVAHRPQRLAHYMEALDLEVRLIAQRLAGRGQVSHIAFGGGSPNAIKPLDFVRLVDRLVTAFRITAPIVSVELDPRGFNDEWAQVLSLTGVNRVSLGVQSFSPAVQAAIGRVQPTALIENCVAQLRRYGVDNINFDLMYGLPGQDEAILLETLGEAVRLKATTISLFGYAHVPHLIPRQRRIDATALPDVHARFDQAASGHAFLLGQHYTPVGFDHYALPGSPLAQAQENGTLRRNFQGFTADPHESLIGIGATAISSFPGLLAQNEKNTGRYRMLVSAGRLPASRGILRTPDDQRRGVVIEHILCFGRANIGPLGDTPGYRQLLEQHEALGLVHWEGDILILSPDARPYARTIAVVFDKWRQAKTMQFSHAI